MIVVIDYDTGNLRSVANALGRLGVDYAVTSDAGAIRGADRVILPGVGEASTAMAKLRQRGLVEVVRGLTQPVLGICIGVQLMCRRSEEGGVECLGIFDTEVRKLGSQAFADAAPRVQVTPVCEAGVGAGCISRASTTAAGLKVPEMGWNTVEYLKTPLFASVEEGAYLYFVHSYAPQVCAQTIARTEYGDVFSAALCVDNFYGTQFHPEKSGSVGERILQNFLRL